MLIISMLCYAVDIILVADDDELSAHYSSATALPMMTSIIPQMMFTLNNGSAVMVQPPQPAGYHLVSPVALTANTVSVPAQVSTH